MLVECIAEKPTADQIPLLGKRYLGPKQSYGVRLGGEYLVFAIDADATVPWVQILDENDHLVSVPLCLFEIVEASLPSIWRARRENTGLHLWPASFFRPFYHEDLLNGEAEVVADFKRVREILETESFRHKPER